MKRTRKPVEDRFWPKVDKDGPVPVDRPELGPCWEWTAYVMPKGYGMIRRERGAPDYAHRVAYELCVGPIPEGLELDHLCRNRRCCNPTHLEPVTAKVNALRGHSPAMLIHKSGRCKRGHEMTDENSLVYVNDGRTRRLCKACQRMHYENRVGRAAEVAA